MKVDSRLEPDIYVEPIEVSYMSIAISLKRIADTLDRANINGENLINAIEGAIYRGLNRG